jgi:hypothetical protein
MGSNVRLGTIALAAASMMSCGPVEADQKSIPAWHKAVPGSAAFLGDDGGGVDTLTVCDTADRYRDWLDENSPPGCQTFQHGLRAVVEVIIFDPVRDVVKSGSDNVGVTIAKIHIPSRNFVGYVHLDALHPVVPPNTMIHFDRKEENKTYQLHSHSKMENDDFIEIHGPFSAKIVNYDPASDDEWDLQLIVLDGEQVGKSGWMLAFEGAKAEDDISIEMFSNAYVYQGGPSLR